MSQWVIPTRSEGSLKIKFDKNVVRLAKVLPSQCDACVDLGHRDPSLRVGMTHQIYAYIQVSEQQREKSLRKLRLKAYVMQRFLASLEMTLWPLSRGQAHKYIEIRML